MKKNILNFEPDYNFHLLAVVTGMRGHRLCWYLEQYLNIRLYRSEDLQLTSNREKTSLFFQVFENNADEDEFHRITVLGNKTYNGFLIPEQKVVDFYMKLEGEFSDMEIQNLENTFLNKIRVQHVFRVDPESLKSKQNLLL